MSLLADVQAASLKWEHKLNHVDQGEAITIVFMQRGAANALVDGKQVEASPYSDRQIDGGFLPADVQYELRIAEGLLTDTDLKRNVGLRHGDRLFRVIQPSPFPPTGSSRYWRFWIAGVEKL
jgi:hypothetical protein